MKWLCNNIWWFLISILFGLFVVFCCLKATSQPLRFSIEFADHTEEFTVFEGENNTSYVFLPSYAEMENLQVLLDTNESILIDDITLTSGMNCGQFSFDIDYTLKNTNGKKSTLRFCKSDNVASIHINTLSGSMQYVDGDKNHEERIVIEIVHPDGTLECYDDGATIHGRGNSSWANAKKSYALKLSTETDVFTMGKARNWVLLANALDATQLRNKLAFDIARNAHMNWVPECQFVDLYLNGEYNGLYLFTEKVEIGASRLNINPENGDFLCKIELSNRRHLLDNPFTTNAGRTVEVVDPKHSLYISQTEIEKKLNELEALLTSGRNLCEEPSFDLDSWVQRYLIDEILGNTDSDCASSYYYCYNGTMYGGPIWDYDYSLMPAEQGQYFIANQYVIDNVFTRPYYSALYANQSFYDRMKEIYETDFLPVLKEMTDYGIDNLVSEIYTASEMNRLRWSVAIDVTEGAERVKSRLKNRVAFLNEIWLMGEVYHSVQIAQTAGNYLTLSVKDGELLNTDLIDLENTVWTVKETGERFDPSQPIHANTILINQTPVHIPDPTETQEIVTWLSIVGLIFFLFVLISIDVYYYHKGGDLSRWKLKR